MVSLKNQNNRSERDPALRNIVILAGLGLFALTIYSVSAGSFISFLSTLSILILASGASFLIGILLGFLFGVPRSLQDQSIAATLKETDSESKIPAIGYLANTNLEQISDWLTKILVGVGLTQIAKIPTKLTMIAEYIARGPGIDSAFVLPVILWFLVCGFLYGYLWTRLALGPMLKHADLRSLSVADAIMKERQAESTAIRITEALLDIGKPPQDIHESDLRNALKDSSDPVRVQVFDKAREFRSKESQMKRGYVKRTIPVFRALIGSDTSGGSHRYHGELGFALKDKKPPSWDKAFLELSNAIEIRDREAPNGYRSWRLYELNRAICQIHIEGKYEQQEESTPEEREKILDDITKAYMYAPEKETKSVFDSDIIEGWMKINQISESNIKERASLNNNKSKKLGNLGSGPTK